MAEESVGGLTPIRVYRAGAAPAAYGEPARVAPPAQAAAARAAAPVDPGPTYADYEDGLPEPPPIPPETRKSGLPIGVIVVCGALIALMSMGIRNIIPLWQTPMLQDLGWSSSQFSIALATQNLMWGLCSPFFGALADKFGSSRVLIFGAMLQASGLWLMSQANDPALFFLSAGVLLGLAQSAAGMGIVLGAVGRSVHPRHRTMAFGLITASSSAGMIVMTPIGRALLETTTWSDAFVSVAIIALPMILLAIFVRSNQNDGDPSTAEIAKLSIGEALSEAFRHRGFTLLVLGFFVCGFHVTFIGVHLPKYLNDLGVGWQAGANALMIIGVFNVGACLAVGFVASVVSKRGVLAMIYLLRAVVILAFISFPVSTTSVYIFAAAMGILWLSTVPPTQGIVAQVFGTQYMTMLFGVVFFSHQIGSFLGVYLGAQAVDRLGSYDMVWYVAIVLGLLAAVCHIVIDERPVARLKQPAAPEAA